MDPGMLNRDNEDVNPISAPEMQAKLAAVRAKSFKDRHLEGPPFPGVKGESVRFYLSLRATIAKLKAARMSRLTSTQHSTQPQACKTNHTGEPGASATGAN